jgi:hypothetical protein
LNLADESGVRRSMSEIGECEMRYSLGTLFVGLMIVALSAHPAAAWCWGCGGCGPYGPVYYGPVYDGCCGEVIAYDDCCCEPCGEVIVEGPPSEPTQQPAPAAPAEEKPQPTMPAQQPPAMKQPAETTPAPVQPPPPEEPSGLFNGTEEAAPPETEEMKKPEAPAEAPADLFGPTEPTPPAEAQPAEKPAEEPAAEPFDLFSEPAGTESEMPAEEKPANEEPAQKQPAEEQPSEDIDDIFGASRSVLSEPGGLASDEMRVWVDNTGSFSTRGRLLSLRDSHVRLLKDNGRTTTVPLNRLSPRDLEFVHRQASAQQAEAYQTVQSVLVTPELAN